MKTKCAGERERGVQFVSIMLENSYGTGSKRVCGVGVDYCSLAPDFPRVDSAAI